MGKHENHTREVLEAVKGNTYWTQDMTTLLVPLLAEVALNLAVIADVLNRINQEGIRNGNMD